MRISVNSNLIGKLIVYAKTREESIRKIVITGKELISSLEHKIEEIENVIRKNKKLVLEEK